jgi:predicted dehydrogenase
MNVGVIGAGMMGRLHLSVLDGIAGVRAAAVTDRDGAALEAARRDHPDLRVHRSTADLLADPDIDLVDIVLPHHQHAPTARAALVAGKHVLLEKPMTLTHADATDLVGLAGAVGRRLFVKSYQREAALTGIARQHGTPDLITGHFRSHRLNTLADPADWRAGWDTAGGGVLFDTGYHFLDWVLHLYGPAHAVTAQCWGSAGRPRAAPDDHATATLELSGGPVAVFTCSWAATPGPPRWHRSLVYRTGVLEEHDDRTRSHIQGLREQVTDDPWRTANVAAVTDAVTAARDGTPSRHDAASAAETLRVLLACYRSSQLGRRIELAGFSPGEWRPTADTLTADHGTPPARGRDAALSA